jgi:4-hydroxy-tetrahydrodipicolinate reductase
VNHAVVVIGAAGRMGRLVTAGLRRAGFDDIAGFDPGAPGPVTIDGETLTLVDDPVAGLAERGVVVDFSHPKATPLLIRAAEARHARLVIGTTGQDAAQMDALRELGAVVPVVLARNFSLGLNRILQILPHVRVLVDDGFDVECVEVHHRQKRDAPSGTALALLEALGTGRAPTVHGRSGPNTLRGPGEVGVHSVRMGQVVGEHTLYFGGEHEVIEIRHRALDRAAFVSGVAPAVRFAARAPAGFYSMLDVMRDAPGADA